MLSWSWIDSASRAWSCFPSSQAPCPLTAQYSSSSGGMAMTPRTGSPVLDQADADGPERQPVDEVAGAVDRVDRPPSRTAAPLGRILLAGQTIVREPLAQAPADQLLEVLIEVGHEAEVRLLDGRHPLRPRNRHRRGLARQLLDELQLPGKLRLFRHFRLIPQVEFRSVFCLFEWFKGMTSRPGPASDDGVERKRGLRLSHRGAVSLQSEKRGVQVARNGSSEDRKCWQRVELGIHGLNRWPVKC